MDVLELESLVRQMEVQGLDPKRHDNRIVCTCPCCGERTTVIKDIPDSVLDYLQVARPHKPKGYMG